jgi:hypothetical protein
MSCYRGEEERRRYALDLRRAGLTPLAGARGGYSPAASRTSRSARHRPRPAPPAASCNGRPPWSRWPPAAAPAPRGSRRRLPSRPGRVPLSSADDSRESNRSAASPVCGVVEAVSERHSGDNDSRHGSLGVVGFGTTRHSLLLFAQSRSDISVHVRRFPHRGLVGRAMAARTSRSGCYRGRRRRRGHGRRPRRRRDDWRTDQGPCPVPLAASSRARRAHPHRCQWLASLIARRGQVQPRTGGSSKKQPPLRPPPRRSVTRRCALRPRCPDRSAALVARPSART